MTQAEVSSFRAQLLAMGLQETSLQTSLEQEKKAREEAMAKLEMVASEAVIVARTELMWEFKDKKSGEWDPNF